MLAICQKSSKKTNILYKCNLSYYQLQKYLEYLISRELLTISNNNMKTFYLATEKGKEFLEGYGHLHNLLEGKPKKNSLTSNLYYMMLK